MFGCAVLLLFSALIMVNSVGLPLFGSGQPRQPESTGDLAFWDSIPDKNDPDFLHEYILRYPQGRFVSLAASKLAKMASAREEGRADARQFCSNCGTALRADQKFCVECGTQAEPVRA
jgi:hypothetical protein